MGDRWSLVLLLLLLLFILLDNAIGFFSQQHYQLLGGLPGSFWMRRSYPRRPRRGIFFNGGWSCVFSHKELGGQIRYSLDKKAVRLECLARAQPGVLCPAFGASSNYSLFRPLYSVDRNGKQHRST